MSDPQIRTALDDYTAHPPAPLPDSAAMLARVRRSRRTHTLTATAVAALAVIAAVSTVVVAGPVGGPARPAATPTSASARAVVSCAGQRPDTPVRPGQPIPADLSTWVKDTVTCTLKATLPRLVPGATFEQVQGAPAGPLIAYIIPDVPAGATGSGPPDPLPLNHQVSAVSIIRDARGGGDLWLTIGVAAPGEKSRQITACQQAPLQKPGYAVPQCELRDGPGGATVAVRSLKEDAPSSSENSVTVVRGNTSIWIASTDSDRISRTDSGAPARTRPNPALTVDQLLELALSPDLVLYP